MHRCKAVRGEGLLHDRLDEEAPVTLKSVVSAGTGGTRG